MTLSKKEEQEIEDSLAETEKNTLAERDMYAGTIDVGTEEMTQEDMNTPILKIIQSNTQDIENKHEGWFYRSDTKQQLETVDVNLVYVTTVEVENYNRTGMEKVKVYFGFYEGTTEPFKMFVRGWSLAGHREFQSEVGLMKNKFKVPMFGLHVTLSTEEKAGTLENGKSYKTNKLVFTIQKDPKDKTGIKPLIEMNADRIGFLFEAASRFKNVAAKQKESGEMEQGEDLPFDQ